MPHKQTPIKIIVIAIGDELIAERVDSNGPALSARLADHGYTVPARLILPDNRQLLHDQLQELVARYDLIVCCGGLGPTVDDITRQAIADAVNNKLVIHPATLQKIKKIFQARKLDMPAGNQRQALIPQTAVVLNNQVGTAAGFMVRHRRGWVAALPGPPRECLTMLEKQLLPKMKRLFPMITQVKQIKTIRICGRPESQLQAVLMPAMKRCPDVQLGFLIQGPSEILVKLAIEDKRIDQQRRQFRQAVNAVKKILGADVVDFTGQPLERVVAKQLQERDETIALAESCTGGLVCSRLTSVPGSSTYLVEGLVTYSNQAKYKRLAVPNQLLKKYGAVSREVALAMARGVRRTSRATWGLAVTGIAGPGGGTAAKPVGLVHIALAGPRNHVFHRVIQARWTADRILVQQLAATTALDSLRRLLSGLPWLSGT